MIDDAAITIVGRKVTVTSQKYKTYNFETSIDELTAALGSGAGRESGILPPAIRWISKDRNTFVFERPPLYAPIFYTSTDKYSAMKVDRENKDQYYLPIPWQTYILTIEPNMTISSFFRPDKLTTMDDTLYIIPLPNVSAYNGGFCHPNEWGGDCTEFLKTDFSIGEAIGFLTNYMWTCNFNNNAGSTVSSGPKELPAGAWGPFLEAWEKLTPHQVLDLSWHVAGGSIETIIASNISGSRGYGDNGAGQTELDASKLAYTLQRK